MKTLITPLGFEIDQIFSFLMAEGFSKQDRIVVIRPKEREDEDRGDKALKKIEELVKSVAPTAQLVKKIVDTKDFEDMVWDISEVFICAEKETVVVNLSGGVRRIIIGLTLCCSFFGDKTKKTYSYCPIEKDIREIQLPYFRCELKENELKILKIAVEDGPVSYTTIANATELSKSSVSRICKELDQRGLLELEERGREILAKTTLTGDLVNANKE